MTPKRSRRKDAAPSSTGSTEARRTGPEQTLRRQAEEKIRMSGEKTLENLSAEEARHLVHELRVHQIELEMQNEELRRAQEELEASRARYYDLYNLAPAGYVTVSEKGLILEANLTAAVLLGVPRSAVIRQPMTRFIVAEAQDVYYRHRKALFATGEQQTFELRLQRPDGLPFWARFDTAMAHDSEGSPVCRAVMIDITDRRKAEEALRQRTMELHHLTETLETRVQERTAELSGANEALRHLSSKLLSTQEEERREIACELHDTFGASLNAIRFRVEMALEQLGDQASPVTQSLRCIVPVIHDTIEECRKIQMELRPPMLDDLGLLATLSWLFRKFQGIYGQIRVAQAIEIEEREIPPSLKIVVFRAAQEAINNIAKHSGADLVHVSLGKGDGRLEFAIRDNGKGFAQEEALAVERTGGRLGLSSMKERVALSGGSMAIESIEGKGTAIRIWWPLQEHAGTRWLARGGAP